jgi:hypothetical protein
LTHWFEAEPARLTREIDAMTQVAPGLVWIPEGSGRFDGPVPEWPFERDAPPALNGFLAGRELRLRVELREGFPMVAPRLTPLDPVPARERRLRERWHLNADGTLCLLFSHASWSGREPAAELVRKAAGWFIEYLLVDAGCIGAMTEFGPAIDETLDDLIADCA